MDLSSYRALLLQARRLVRSTEDAEDLVQSVLLIALQMGRDEPAWLAGVLRNQAALAVRSAVRSRNREAAAASVEEARAEAPESIDPLPLLRQLPAAARRVALLALHGLSADEIRWILGLKPAAFRQRLTSIRKALGTLPQGQRIESLALAYVRDPPRATELEYGLVRRALKAAVMKKAGLGTHDPDGHLLVIRNSAHTSAPGGN